MENATYQLLLSEEEWSSQTPEMASFRHGWIQGLSAALFSTVLVSVSNGRTSGFERATALEGRSTTILQEEAASLHQGVEPRIYSVGHLRHTRFPKAIMCLLDLEYTGRSSGQT